MKPAIRTPALTHLTQQRVGERQAGVHWLARFEDWHGTVLKEALHFRQTVTLDVERC